jgi:16S rRNA (uracil1498-N3)-methyltransferase
MDYFYTPQKQISPTHCLIEGEEFAHLTHVMRRTVGDAIRVVDGVGTAYDVVIEEISRRTARCRITARHMRLHEPSRRLILGTAILKKGSNFDFLLEKTTELGVGVIVPLLTERTIPRHARIERWQKIALAATKQCGRCIIPEIHPPTSLQAFLRNAPEGAARFIPHERAEGTKLSAAIPAQSRDVVLCIGPEGGFTDGEVACAVSAGFIPVTLGPRRLRAETAAICAAGLVLLEA